MDKELKQIEEKISNYKDIRKNLWATFILLTGGIATLLIDINSFIKIILLLVGVLFESSLIFSISIFNEKIEFLIKQIHKKE
jgi:hypothetical protein